MPPVRRARWDASDGRHRRCRLATQLAPLLYVTKAMVVVAAETLVTCRVSVYRTRQLCIGRCVCARVASCRFVVQAGLPGNGPLKGRSARQVDSLDLYTNKLVTSFSLPITGN